MKFLNDVRVKRAMVTAGVSFPACSMESLSRGAHYAADHDLVIVDEAHHFRNSSTLRYHALANLTRRARVLLLSATPLQNSRADLAAMLALFAGPAVNSWSDPVIARLIVRRDAASAEQSLPVLAGPLADPRPLLKRASALVLPSEHEAMGLVLVVQGFPFP